jgi:NUMOD3 motif
MTTIYGLADDTGAIRYIGMTVQRLNDRLTRHVSGAHVLNTTTAKWIRSMPNRPTIHPLLQVEAHEASEAERQFIAAFRAEGITLTNSTIGGCGAPGHVKSAESIERQASKIRGRKHTPEACARMAESRRGLKRSEETKANMRAAWERRHAEGRAAMSAETKKKLSDGKRGILVGPRSEETKAKQRAAWVRRKARIMGQT